MNKRILCPIVIGIFFNFLSSVRAVLKKGVMRTLLVPTLMLLSTGVWSSANAATYNVRTDGSDSCNGSANASSSSAPNCAFKTVQKAADTAAAGDKVIIQAGTYSGAVTFSKSGTASAPITFTASGDAIIRGNVKTTGNYNILDKVTISPPSTGGYGAVTLNGQHNTLSNCLVTNYGAPASDQATAIIFDNGGAYNLVEKCTIRDLTDIDVFHVNGHDQTIRNNYITNVNGVNYAANHTDIVQAWGWSGASSYNIVFEGNLVTNSKAQLGNLSNDNISTLHDWSFRNNVFANIDACIFSGIPKTYYYNNIFSNVGKAQGYAVSLYTQNNYSSVGDKFVNNVFINNGEDINFHSGNKGDIAVFTNNYFSGANNAPKTNGQAMGSNFINGGDPKFVNVTGFDFHTQAGSVLIGKGSDLSSSFTTDKDGNTRSSEWDIGSYQYKTGTLGTTGTGTTGASALTAPQNLRIVQ